MSRTFTDIYRGHQVDVWLTGRGTPNWCVDGDHNRVSSRNTLTEAVAAAKARIDRMLRQARKHAPQQPDTSRFTV